jgi:hypothetical protein
LYQSINAIAIQIINNNNNMAKKESVHFSPRKQVAYVPSKHIESAPELYYSKVEIEHFREEALGDLSFIGALPLSSDTDLDKTKEAPPTGTENSSSKPTTTATTIEKDENAISRPVGRARHPPNSPRTTRHSPTRRHYRRALRSTTKATQQSITAAQGQAAAGTIKRRR